MCLHLCVCVYVCTELRENNPHLSIGNTFEDTCNKLDTCYSREFRGSLNNQNYWNGQIKMCLDIYYKTSCNSQKE